MKKGVAGVRLCDVASCYQKWPCNVHGTMAVEQGLLVQVQRHVPGKAAVKVGRSLWSAVDVESARRDTKCVACGYGVCACPPEQPKQPEPSPLPEGWKEHGQGGAIYGDIAAVRFLASSQVWEWRVGNDESRFVTGRARTRIGAINSAQAEMAAADEEDDDDLPDGWAYNSLALDELEHERGAKVRQLDKHCWEFRYREHRTKCPTMEAAMDILDSKYPLMMALPYGWEAKSYDLAVSRDGCRVAFCANHVLPYRWMVPTQDGIYIAAGVAATMAAGCQAADKAVGMLRGTTGGTGEPPGYGATTGTSTITLGYGATTGTSTITLGYAFAGGGGSSRQE